VNGSFGPAITPTLSYDGSGDNGSLVRRMRPVRGEPTMIMSNQQAHLSGRKRGCRPLERSVVGDL
jgi:hypothetical protein